MFDKELIVPLLKNFLINDMCFYVNIIHTTSYTQIVLLEKQALVHTEKLMFTSMALVIGYF